MIKNPFLQSARLTVYIKQNKQTVIDTRNNFNSVKGVFTSQQEFEKDPFLKLYNDKAFFNVFKDISDTASKMFLYIAYNLPKSQDIISLVQEDVMKFVGIKSVTTYYKYIQELIDYAIISRRSNSEYWVNPLFLFNGDRVAFYREHCPECLDEINLSEIQESRTIKKKKQLIEYFNCKNYYQLKCLLGDDQIERVLNKELELHEIKLLK